MAGNSGLFNHGFSDEKTIHEILKSYFGVDFTISYLDEVLFTLAKEYSRIYSGLQPTYAAFSSQVLGVKFSYMIKRVLELFDLTEEQKINATSDFWKMAESICSLKSAARKSWHHHENTKEKNEIKLFVQKKEVIKNSNDVAKTEILLLKYIRGGVFIDSYASFEGEDLLIDYWKFSDQYEDEYLITVKAADLPKLYTLLSCKDANKTTFLKLLQSKFNGEQCFEKIKKYLDTNNIPFYLQSI